MVGGPARRAAMHKERAQEGDMNPTRLTARTPLRLWLNVLVALAMLLSFSGAASAANPDPVLTFYMPLPEGDALAALRAINTEAVSPVYDYSSIAIAVSGTYVYYDQWENGYDSDIANPTNLYSSSNLGGTQVWGNKIAADGCAPNINGVPFTCTDGADYLNAGDVIIPYNSVAVTPQCNANVVRDEFSTVAYNNNDGTNNWATDWVETGDNGLAESGDILITSNQLRFVETEGGSGRSGDRIDRTVDLSGQANVVLSFTLGWSEREMDGSDELRVYVSTNGVDFTQVANFGDGTPATIQSIDISAYASATTWVEFISRDALETGEYWTIDNVDVSYDCAYVRNPATLAFDARDKIAASSWIAMARATWATGSGTLNAFGHEMYSTAEWGTAYEAPVGTNTAYPAGGYTDQGMFEYSALSIMASQSNTTVQIDADANGSYETTVVLNEGNSYLATGTLQGARVQADKPIQVLLLTGDIGSNYESRDINLLATSQYGSSYWSPVGVNTGGTYTPGPTRIFLYNPSTNGNIYITCEYNSTTSTQPVAPRGVVYQDLATGQAAHCFASTAAGVATKDPIFAIGTVDTALSGTSAGQAGDWSFTLYPDSFLTTDALVGLGLGKDPTDTTSTENGSPLWVTPTCNTYVYVDWNNDGAADPVDTNGDGTAETGSQNGILVNRLASVTLYEPGLDEEEYDQSGARVWSRTASGVGYGGTPGCTLALAWGQDPRRATAGSPGLDVGTAVPPMRLIQGSKGLALKTDVNGDGQLGLGDIATYNITVRNAGPTQVDNVYVWDQVPDHTTYRVGTAEKDLGSGWVSIADDTDDGTAFPLDHNNDPLPDGVYLGTLPLGATYYVRFDVTLSNDLDYEDILNCGFAFTAAGTVGACASNQVASRDWGDLPDSYGTSRSADGARHSASALRLGSTWDLELQGVPTAGANGDDEALTPNDEDGVMLGGTALSWQNGTGEFTVVVSGGSGYLNVWMDLTDNTGSGAGSAYADGDFEATGGYDTYTSGSTYSEHIVQDLAVSTGVNVITFSVPVGLIQDLQTNQFYFRFRLSPAAGGVTPRGLVAGGEVEDYLFDLDDVPTQVLLSNVTAEVHGGQVMVAWQTEAEYGTAGFRLFRQGEGSLTLVGAGFVPAFLNQAGGQYWLVDETAQPGGTYVYQIEEVLIGGGSHLYGPFELTATGAEASAQRDVGSGGFGRHQRSPDLPVLPAGPEPNTSTDVPAALPEPEDREGPIVRPTVPLQQEDLGAGSGEAQAASVAVTAAKMTVRETGLYFVAIGDIAGALGTTESQAVGLMRSGNLKLSNQGQDVAYLPASANSGFYFYGLAPNGIFAADNVYWLERGKGTIMKSLTGKVPAALAMGTFMASSHAEQNVAPVPALVADPNADYWMWKYLVAGATGYDAAVFEMQADGAAPGGTATLTVHLQGVTSSGVDMEHRAAVRVNGTDIGEVAWTGMTAFDGRLEFDSSLLVDGVNSVEVTAVKQPLVPYRMVAVNCFDLTYLRYFRAYGNQLTLTGGDSKAVTVYGLSSKDVLVFDLDNPLLPKQVSSTKVDVSGGKFRVTFKPAAGEIPYLVIATNAVRRITTLAADTPSNLRGSDGAQYLIITTAALREQAQVLADYRQGQGLSSLVVDVQDAYDEFSYGLTDPQGIDDLISHAYLNWQTRPKYVLLAGSGSFDYKNYLGMGDCLVPPQMLVVISGLVPADGLYADVTGDAAPEVAVGRLPVVTPDEFAAYVAKIQAYESADPRPWAKRVLLLADNKDPLAGDFAADSNLLAGLVPSGYKVVKAYRDSLSYDQARSKALAALQSGVGLFNYVGHGGYDQLTGQGVVKSSDVETLSDGPRLPLMSAATCVVGDYGMPGYRTLSTLMALRSNGGAAAVFAPTGPSYDADAVGLMSKLFEHLYGAGGDRLGDATLPALAEYFAEGGALYAVRSYNLQGDPAVLLSWR